MTTADLSSEALSDALAFAALAHRSQRRKDEERTPYILHPTRVMLLLWEVGVRDPLPLQAALLHDTLEDTETRYEELAERFGDELAAVVAEVSDDKALPKRRRKQLQIEKATSLSYAARLVKIADKIDNLTDILRGSPVGWSDERARLYFGWAFRVVDPLRGTHAALEARFDRIYSQGDPLPWPDDET